MECKSCGMAMTKAEQFSMQNMDSEYCIYCTDEDGKLLPKNVVRKSIIQYWMHRDGISQEEAEEKIDSFMQNQPAWSESK
ncbi:MAG: zinc ribbon domain-containing protein [Candidatus Thorarchaeota archaeon]